MTETEDEAEAIWMHNLAVDRTELTERLAAAIAGATDAKRAFDQVTRYEVGVDGELSTVQRVDLRTDLEAALHALRSAARTAREDMEHFLKQVPPESGGVTQ